jgi:hypothetical protein
MRSSPLKYIVVIFAMSLSFLNAATLQSDPVTLRAKADLPAAKKLIFLDFHNEANDQNLQFLSNSFGDGIHSAIEGKYRYTRIASDVWKKYARDKKWQPADFFNIKKIREMGRDLGADGVIYGKFVSGKENLEIHGVIFSVIDGEIIGEERGSAKLDSTMFDAVNRVSANLAQKIKDLFVPSDRGALWRSALLPGWGHFYKERRDWGYFWSIAGATALAYTLTTTAIFLVYHMQYKNSSPDAYRNSAGQVGLYDESAAQAEFDRLENITNRWGSFALAGVIATAVIYSASLVHAWFIKPDLGNITPGGAVTALKFNFGVENIATPGIYASLKYQYRWGENE